MNRNIFFDLDGTLIDSRLRLYLLFCEITLQKKLNFDDYWKLKRNKNDHKTILMNCFGYSENDCSDFEHKWLSLIEDKKYLYYDKPFFYTKEVLSKLKQRDIELYIVTARQNKKNAVDQILNFNLNPFFEDILVTERRKSKLDLLKESISFSKEDILIGDTGLDVITAKALGIKSIAVLSGFRNKITLAEYKPDFIVNDIRFLIDYVTNTKE